MTDEKRPYRKKARAEAEAETRRRITESAVELHGTVGPAQTSMSAIAERAGVRRSTLYRHFPDEDAIVDACSQHWAERNLPPDPTGWAAIDDPGERLNTALGALYPYYRGRERMLSNLHRDEAEIPAVARTFGTFHAYLEAVRETLMRGQGARGRRRDVVRAAIGHALAFGTWRSLGREQGLDDPQAAQLMRDLVAAARDGG